MKKLMLLSYCSDVSLVVSAETATILHFLRIVEFPSGNAAHLVSRDQFLHALELFQR
jgi:hypothetical protein